MAKVPICFTLLGTSGTNYTVPAGKYAVINIAFNNQTSGSFRVAPASGNTMGWGASASGPQQDGPFVLDAGTVVTSIAATTIFISGFEYDI